MILAGIQQFSHACMSNFEPKVGGNDGNCEFLRELF